MPTKKLFIQPQSLKFKCERKSSDNSRNILSVEQEKTNKAQIKLNIPKSGKIKLIKVNVIYQVISGTLASINPSLFYLTNSDMHLPESFPVDIVNFGYSVDPGVIVGVSTVTDPNYILNNKRNMYIFELELVNNSSETIYVMIHGIEIEYNVRNHTVISGDIGPTGPIGEKGDRGKRGKRGATGLMGPIGETGPDGLIGATGPPAAASIIYWNSGGEIGNNMFMSYNSMSVNETSTRIVAPRDGILSNLYADLIYAPGGSTTRTLTVRINGIDTPLTTTLLGSDINSTNITNQVTVSKGNRISIHHTTIGSPVPSSVAASAMFS